MEPTLQSESAARPQCARPRAYLFSGARVCDPQPLQCSNKIGKVSAHLEFTRCCGSQTRAPLNTYPPAGGVGYVEDLSVGVTQTLQIALQEDGCSRLIHFLFALRSANVGRNQEPVGLGRCEALVPRLYRHSHGVL